MMEHTVPHIIHPKFHRQSEVAAERCNAPPGGLAAVLADSDTRSGHIAKTLPSGAPIESLY